jgi:hypothetical protein
MANGGANISRGINRGAAQVYDTSGPVNMYARLMQQQQLKRAAETKALTDEFGKLTPEGIRQQDVEIFVEQVGKWKNASIEASKERDPVKKAIKTQEAEQEKIKSYALKDYSKSEGKKRSDFASSMLIPNNRDNFTPEAIDIFRETDKYSVNDPRYLSDLTTLQQQIDGSTTMAEIAKINKVLLDASQPTRVERKGNEGNRVGTFVTYNKQIQPKEQIDAMSLAFRVSPKLRAGLRQIYPEQANLSNDEFIATVIPDYVSKNPATEYGEEKFKPDDNWREKQLANDRLIRTRKSEGDAEEESTYRQQIVRGIMNNDKESIDEMRAYLPSGSKVDYRTSTPTKTSKGGYNLIRVDIPAVSDVDGTIKKPGIVEDISLSLGDAKNRLNAILSEYTGEKISPSKLNIKGGKPRGEQIEIKGQEKTNKPASTVSEYTGITTVKDAKGNSFQIGVKDGKWYNIKTGKIYQ